MMAVTETSNRSKKIHPHKFLMWMGIGSICMMFAGLTSAYIVKRNQANWEDVQLSPVFLYSTMVIVSSSITMYLALKAFKARQMLQYKNLITITVILGLVFAYLQYIGFKAMANHGVLLIGTGSNAAASFLIVIIGLHVLHVLGGVVALLITFFRAFRTKVKSYSPVPIEIVSTYWHFVDILWIYLYIFLYVAR
ncbi:heme-copper oxidase subunit III [Hydrotalea sp. AMD]|uniref:cytochrome c oxidase subunit 3 n=1 Tax=Hydrotalea sp. AMD TaxID=2501297 RepID=UPI000944F541|nr:heme-copper oxidase subunit III [Hydrotalea sp. AMD]